MGRASNARNQLIEAILDLMWVQNYSSLTIDAICDAAGVRKGSFYHFFKSKAELTQTAFEHAWEANIQPRLDTLYSPTRPPLERLRSHIAFIRELAAEKQAEHGRVLGCPFFNVGTEVSNVEPLLIEQLRDILERYKRYLESALRDAMAEGAVKADTSPELLANFIFALIEGSLTEARISNDLGPIDRLPEAVDRFLHPTLAAIA